MASQGNLTESTDNPESVNVQNSGESSTPQDKSSDEYAGEPMQSQSNQPPHVSQTQRSRSQDDDQPSSDSEQEPPSDSGEK